MRPERLPATLLRLEGAALFAAAVALYGLKYPSAFTDTHLQRV